MEWQHINVKFYLEDPSAIKPAEFNAVFQTWIQNKVSDELLIDVADYLHVPEGPGMILIGFEADYALDNTKGRWGLKYNRKATVTGSGESRILNALRKSLEACQRLENEKTLSSPIRFRSDEFEIFINDRASAPNTLATLTTAQPDLENALNTLFPNNNFSLEFETDPRARFGAIVKTEGKSSLQELLSKIK